MSVPDPGVTDWVPMGSAPAAPPQYAIPVQLLNPRSSTLGGNSFFTVLALTAWDAGHWEFVKDVEGRISGVVRLPVNPATITSAELILEIGANATTGVTRLQVATKAVANGESMNPATLTAEAAQDITVPGTAYFRKKVTFPIVTEALASEDLLFMEITHLGAHANDTLAQNTLLFGAWLSLS